MQGTELHMFPVVCRTYQQPDETLNQRVIKSMDGYPSQMSNFPEGVITSRPDLHKVEEGPITELRQFFWDCLAEYRYAYKLYCDALEISSMWFNHAPANSGVGHPLHRHPMSYLSAVYYLTPGAATYFEDPVTPRTSDTLDVFQGDLMERDQGCNEKLIAQENKLILFPSWLRHYSGRQLDNYDRWTISFNVFPCGNINVGPFEMPQLKVSIE